MLTAGRQVAPRPHRERGALIALPARRLAPLPPPNDRRVAIVCVGLSLLFHAMVLLISARQAVMTASEPPPIKVTLLGTRPDAGGSGAAPAPAPPAPAPVAPPPAAPPLVKVKPAPVAPPVPVSKAKQPPLRRPAPVPEAPQRAAVAAPAPAPAAPLPRGDATGDAGGGYGAGSGSGNGVGRGHRDGVQGDPSGSAIAGYLDRLRQRLEAVKRYPLLARRRGQVGTATIQIAIDRHGRPAAVHLHQSSGSEVLDEEATAMVTRAAPFEPLPADVGSELLQITVPVRFDVSS